VRFTDYFRHTRRRPDRAAIRLEWVAMAVWDPLREEVQPDGRIRRWVRIPGEPARYLRVVLLEDGLTVHNAFLDRRFEP
jgi:hypothetical protein